MGEILRWLRETDGYHWPLHFIPYRVRTFYIRLSMAKKGWLTAHQWSTIYPKAELDDAWEDAVAYIANDFFPPRVSSMKVSTNMPNANAADPSQG